MRQKPTIAPRECSQCHKTYQPTGTAQRYCPECAQQRSIQHKREYEARQHPNRKPRTPNTEVCCICGKPFASHFDGKPYCNTHYLRLHFHGTAECHPRQRTNTYDTQGDVTTITTSNGKTFLIDTADLDTVKRYSWCFSKTGYLVANINHRVVKLHRYLLNPEPGIIIDHINGDPSDNRRCNLRLCTQAQNARNCALSKNSSTGYSGISLTRAGKYRARITVNRKEIRLGNYDSLDDAIAARKNAEARYYEEFAPSTSRISISTDGTSE